MATAATTLLDWQPLFHLEKENYQLREENRHLHFQVKELMQWKEKALKHMVALGPKRHQAQRDVAQATQLQRKLQAVEKTLQERVALEEATHALEEQAETLQTRVTTLEQEKSALLTKCDQLRAREAEAKEHVQQLADTFRVHLERLVAIRESLDEEEPTRDSDQGIRHAIPAIPSPEDDANERETVENPEIIIAGLAAVSDKCLRWFHQHVAQTFAEIQRKAALYESQHVELEQVRTRVQSIRVDQEQILNKGKHNAQRVTELEQINADLERQIHRLTSQYSAQTQGHTQMSDHVRLLVTEVRQYLRLVRTEIKKKFGYIPDAITHADTWTKILDAMDVLERQLRIATR